MLLGDKGIIDRGRYYGSKSIVPHSIQWFLKRGLIRLLVLLGISFICTWLNGISHVFLYGSIVFIASLFVFYPYWFRCCYRIDFYANTLVFFLKSPLSNLCFTKELVLKTVRVRNNQSKMSLVFEGSIQGGKVSNTVVVSTNDGWTKKDLNSIFCYLTENECSREEEIQLSSLHGNYIGSISMVFPSNTWYFHYLFPLLIGVLLVLGGIILLFEIKCSLFSALFIAIYCLCVFCNTFSTIHRVDFYKDQIVFIDKDIIWGQLSSTSMQINGLKKHIIHSILLGDVLIIKEKGKYFPIYLSSRQGWCAEQIHNIFDQIELLLQ